MVEHASGLRPTHETPFMALSPATLVPPWGADTHDGYDIYAGNWPCDPSLIPSTPIGAHKASEGFGTYDAKFGEWVKTVSARHRYRGAYHVIWPWRAGKADNYIEQQAESFYNFTRAMGVDWMQPGWFVQIDNEQFSGMPRIANVEEVRRFADWLIARIGNKVSHYCNPVTDPGLFFSTQLTDLPKWEAQYNRNPSRSPTMIRQWGGWVVNGIWNGRPCDANYIEKQELLDKTVGYTEAPPPPPPPPPEGFPMGNHIAWMEVVDDANQATVLYYGELIMRNDGVLVRTDAANDAPGVFGLPRGRATKQAYEVLPVWNPTDDAKWLFQFAPPPTPVTNLTPVMTAIAAMSASITSINTAVSNGFAATNNNITLVGASVSVARQQLDAITATVHNIEAAINTGGTGGGDCDLTPVLEAVAALSAKLDDLEVTVNLNGTGTTK